MAFDSVRNQVVMFGGYNNYDIDLQDTWVWDGVNWTQKTPATSPPARDSHGMVFDVARGQVVLFGGSLNDFPSGDTWTWDGTNWTQKAPTASPSARLRFGFVYDSTNNQSVLFGGTPDFESGLNDTWVWNGTNWTNRTASITGAPSARGGFGMAYDFSRAHVVLFGGEDFVSEGTPLNDTWYFDNSSWTQFVPPSTPPSPRYDASMTYDAVHANTVLFGGYALGPLDTKTWLLGALQPLPTSLPDATMGANYDVPFSATGGQPSYNFSVSGLPPGLSVSPANHIVGQCTGQSSTGVTITVTDSASNTASTGPVPLHCNPYPILTTATPQQGILGIPYSITFQTNAVYDPPGAAPYTWATSNCQLPSNFTISSTGVLTGTASEMDTYLCTITFTDRWGASASKTYTFNFYSPLTVSGGALPAGTAGTAYPATQISSYYAGGAPPLTVTVAGLPAGLSFNSSTGIISGTPTQYGTFTPVLSVTDNYGEMGQANLSLTIAASPAITITTASPLPSGAPGVAYSAQISFTGGVAATGYSVNGTSLPSWLSINSANMLVGTPPAVGSYSFTITVHDFQTPSQNSTTKSFTLSIVGPLVITTASPLPAATAGVAYSQTLSASGGNGIYVWTDAGLPSGLILNGTTGVLSGTPPSAGTFSFQLSVTSAGTTVSKTFSLTVNSALTISTASPLPAATLNSPYTITFTASGGSGGYTWLASGLPSGFSLTSAGVLTGTPTSTGTISFNVTVTDSLNNTATQPFALPVNAALTITNTSPLPPATVGTAYTVTFNASGGTGGYTWSATGLPSWLTLTSNGSLSGTPPNAGPVMFQVTVVDSSASTKTMSFTLPVNSALVIGTTSPLPTATVGSPYSQQLAASGGSGTYSWTATGLPSWLTLTAGGLLSGNPPSPGPVNFAATVTDGLGATVSRSFILPVSAALTIGTTSPLPAATVGAPYTLQLTASGGTGSYSWTGSSLPAWLTISSGGLLSGTPPGAGSYAFSVTVTDTSSQAATKSLTLPINAMVSIGTLSPLPRAVAGTPYSVQFTASGGSGSYTWTGASLPAWLMLNSGGYLSGTPPSAGTVTFSVTATDNLSQSDTRLFSLTTDSVLSFATTSPLPSAAVGVPYSLQLVANGGSGVFTWTSSSLPSWLSLSATGILAGTPPTPTSATFPVTVMDSDGQTITGSFTLPVNLMLTISTVSPLAPATLNSAYSQQFAASGGSGSYTWTGTSLPSWLTLSTSGLLTGTPPSAGTVTFSVTATDTLSNTATKSFSLTTNAALTISTVSPLAPATLNSAYSQQFAASGGSGSYTWSGTSLPSWLTLSTSGLLTGTPPSAGTIMFSVIATDTLSNTVTKSFSLTTNAALTISTASPLPPATLNTAYSQQFAASGGSGSYTWSGTSLPSWLTLSTSGLLTGTPPSAGTVTFSITATDTLSNTATKSFSLTTNAALTISTVSPLAPATLNTAYSQQFAASGGSGSYTWSGTSLPSWLTLSISGLLTGTPPSAGTITFSVTATDTLSNTVTKSFSLTTNGNLTISTASPLAPATLNSAYSQQLAASGGSGSYTWTGTSLPTWLTLSTSGLLTGTPPSAGTVTFSITATDTLSNTTTKTFSLTTNGTLTISTASPLAPATLNSAYSQQFAASGGSGSYTWSGTSLPSWLTLSTSGLLTGTPSSAGTITFSITATDALNQSATKSFSLDVSSALNITTRTPLSPATIGMPYSMQFAASGGSGSYTWSTAAPLPSWLTLSSSGSLFGTPPTADPVTFVIIVSDSASNQFRKAFTLPVNAVLTIDTLSPLPSATVNAPYSQQLSASGGSGNYTWTGSNLPGWLTISSTGLISGTPPSAETVLFAATVADSLGRMRTASFSFNVNAAIRIDTASPLSPATVSSVYSVQFTASGGTGRYTWAGSTLPSGFSISSAGLLTGIPSSSDTLSFNVQVNDDRNNSASAIFTLPVSSVLSISNNSPLPAAVPSKVYALQFNASGGSGSYTWSSNSLPSWLTLSPAGFLTGVPPAAGNVVFAITATDGQGRSTTKSFTLPVISTVSITTPTTLPIGSVGQSFSIQLTATGGTGNYTWGGTGVPSFLALSSTGVLVGTPAAGGNFIFNVTVTDSSNANNSATQTFMLSVIYPSPPAIITSSPLPAGTVGTLYALAFAASGGSGVYTWTASNLPASFAFSGAGQLRGIPTAAGDFSFTVTVVDSQSGQTVSRSYLLSVSSALTITTASPLSTAVTGQPYSAQLAVSGGSAPYIWSATDLPTLFTISSSGLLTGVATSAATINFTVTVRDAAGRTASRNLAIPVNATLTINSPSTLASGVVNTTYIATLTAVGGIGAYTWTGTGLPAWATLSAGGVLSGTPPVAGSFTIYASVMDTAGSTASKQFTIFIATGTPLALLSSTLVPCVVNVVCTQSIGAAGGTPPYTFSLAGPPPTANLSLSPNGQLTGTFAAPGTISVQVLLTDAVQNKVTATLSLSAVPAVAISAPETITAPLGGNFTLTPTVLNGAPPYTWSLASGSLPPGVVLSFSTGVLSGVATQPGTYTFTLQISDLTGLQARTVITIMVPAPVLTIQTATVLPATAAGSVYSQAFQASNGTGNLTWSLISGSIAPGLIFSSAGILSGTPTQSGDFAFTVQVADSKGTTDSRTFQLHVSGPSQPLPPVSTSLSATVNAGEQPSVTLTLGSPYPLPITVTAKLSLTPNQGDTTDLLFPNGARTIQFILPANLTQTTVPFQVGTLAGTVQISFQLQAAGVDITPNPAPSAVTQIAAAAPVIRSFSVSLVNGGFQLTVIGFSTTRNVKTAAFHFTAANGASLQSSDFSLDVTSLFTQWYADPASLPIGSQFSLTVPVSITGNISAIDSVSITLTNSIGASTPATAKVQ